MTKARLATVAVFGFLAVAVAMPAASAHGAPQPREIDARVLSDWTGPGGEGEYGGDDALRPGHDLLALDVREAYDPESGQPAIYFRITWQGGDPSAGTLREELALTAGGKEHVFSIQTEDGATFTHDFDLLLGPFDVGDGHPKAFDAIVRYDTLGVGAGDEVSGIELRGSVGESGADVMPGGFAVEGVELPADPTFEAGPGGFTLQGPAPLVAFEPGEATVDASKGSQKVSLTLSNALESLDQFATISAKAPPGVEVLLASRTANLPTASPQRTVLVTVTAEPGVSGAVAIVASSDLGGKAEATIDVQGPEPVAAPRPSQGVGNNTTGAGQAEPDGDEGDGGSSPGFIIPSFLLATALAALAARRRT